MTPVWTPIWLNACCSPVKSKHQDHKVGVDVHWQLDEVPTTKRYLYIAWKENPT